VDIVAAAAAGEEAEVADAVDFDVIVLHQLAEHIKRIARRRPEFGVVVF